MGEGAGAAKEHRFDESAEASGKRQRGCDERRGKRRKITRPSFTSSIRQIWPPPQAPC